MCTRVHIHAYAHIYAYVHMQERACTINVARLTRLANEDDEDNDDDKDGDGICAHTNGRF